MIDLLRESGDIHNFGEGKMENEKRKKLTFRTSGNWTPDELSEFFKSISGIYQVFLCIDYAEKHSKEFQKLLDGSAAQRLTASEVYQNFENYIGEEQRLEISSIKMASPGDIVFSGVAQTIAGCGAFMKIVFPDFCRAVEKETKNFFLALLKKQTKVKEERKLQNAIKKLLKDADKEKEVLKELEKCVNSIKRLQTKKKIQKIK